MPAAPPVRRRGRFPGVKSVAPAPQPLRRLRNRCDGEKSAAPFSQRLRRWNFGCASHLNGCDAEIFVALAAQRLNEWIKTRSIQRIGFSGEKNDGSSSATDFPAKNRLRRVAQRLRQRKIGCVGEKSELLAARTVRQVTEEGDGEGRKRRGGGLICRVGRIRGAGAPDGTAAAWPRQRRGLDSAIYSVLV